MNICSNDLESLNFLKEINYFKETSISGYISLNNKFEDIKKPLTLFTNVIINSVKLFTGNKLVSNEGQYLNTHRLLIDYSIKENLKYISYHPLNNIFFYSSPTISKYCYISLPSYINNIDIEDIINKKLYNISPYIENVEFCYIDKRTFYYNVTILINFLPLIKNIL
ncbi:hypothetical protein [Clostridium weizhouense]|uniref:Uncharacterized protein n=1 Tax=Clostridium weizhouense TaxID=2859781 RepID=A0ABS7AKS3_9CLOT|nr:hypothetical protein [Clostridium weizhouense]MBW6409270.1 hypothetical protein [Clostridium weizhouense]